MKRAILEGQESQYEQSPWYSSLGEASATTKPAAALAKSPVCLAQIHILLVPVTVHGDLALNSQDKHGVLFIKTPNRASDAGRKSSREKVSDVTELWNHPLAPQLLTTQVNGSKPL